MKFHEISMICFLNFSDRFSRFRADFVFGVVFFSARPVEQSYFGRGMEEAALGVRAGRSGPSRHSPSHSSSPRVRERRGRRSRGRDRDFRARRAGGKSLDQGIKASMLMGCTKNPKVRDHLELNAARLVVHSAMRAAIILFAVARRTLTQ